MRAGLRCQEGGSILRYRKGRSNTNCGRQDNHVRPEFRQPAIGITFPRHVRGPAVPDTTESTRDALRCQTWPAAVIQ